MVENVDVSATNELDNSTFRKCRGASVQLYFVTTDCNKIHVPAGVVCLSLASKAGFLHLLAKLLQTLFNCTIRVKLACIANILTV